MPKLSDHIHTALHEGIRAGTTTLLVIPVAHSSERVAKIAGAIAGCEFQRLDWFNFNVAAEFRAPQPDGRRFLAECPVEGNSTHEIDGVGRIRVTAIDCKRLQEISEEECRAHGLRRWRGYIMPTEKSQFALARYRDAFATRWNVFHGKDGWQANPMCWYVTVEKEPTNAAETRNKGDE